MIHKYRFNDCRKTDDRQVRFSETEQLSKGRGDDYDDKLGQ